MITVESGIEKFRNIVSGFETWKLLVQSHFTRLTAVFQSIAIRDALFYVERTLQEFFPSTAVSTSSIRAHMQDRGYIPRKSQPSTGYISITNQGDSDENMPADFHFSAGNGLTYLLPEAVVIPANSTVTDILIEQLEKQSIEFTVEKEQPFYEILLDSSMTERIYKFEVYVKADDTFEKWEYVSKFQNINAGDQVYDEFFHFTNRIGIRFGNFDFGVILGTGTEVRVDCWLTQGDTSLLEGQKLKAVDNTLNKILAVTSENVIGGSSQEDIEESRAGLHYWANYQNTLLWEEDYLFYIKRNVAGLIWLKAWGEEEQEKLAGPDVAHINKIFVSGYKPGTSDTALSETILNHLELTKQLNKQYEWVTPVFIGFSVKITGVVDKRVNIANVTNEIYTVLNANYGKDSVNRKTDVFLKDLYKLITGTGYFVDDMSYFLTEIIGKYQPKQINEYVYLNLAASEFEIKHI